MRISPDRRVVVSMFEKKRMSNDVSPMRMLPYGTGAIVSPSIGVAETPLSSNEALVISHRA